MRSGKVMVLASDRRLRLSRARALAGEGYDVTGVATVQEAAQVSRRQPFDLVVADVESVESLRALLAELPPEVSVLMVISEDTFRRAVPCAGPGVHAFLVRPFDTDQLAAAVAASIERMRQISERIQGRALSNLSKLVGHEADLDRLFKSAVEVAAEATGADYASLSVKDEATGVFVTRAQAGEKQSQWEDVLAEALRLGEPLALDQGAEGHPGLRDMMARAGIAALLCMPQTIRGSLTGEMSLIKRAPGSRFTSSEQLAVTLLTHWSGLALENSRLFDRVHRQYLHMERLLEEIRVAQDNERRRVAAEIHDGVAQWMVGASYDIKAAGKLVSQSRLADLEVELARIRNTVQTSIKELRRAIANLRPLALEELGLAAAIRQAAKSLEDDQIKCRTEIDADLPRLTPAQESTTYWIVQEVLSNVRKHAAAKEVTVRVSFHEGQFSVEVSDDGCGFVPKQVMNSPSPLGHLGLLGMKERAELLGGSLTIDSGPGKGTCISFAFRVRALETVEARA